MRRCLGRAVSFVLAMVFIAPSLFAATVTSAASGNWSSPGTWSGGVPFPGDDVIILGAHTVTVDVTSIDVNSLQVDGAFDATNKTVDIATDLTGTGSIDITNATVNLGGNFTNTGAFTSTNSTFTYNGTGAQSVRDTTYFNLSVNKTAGTATLVGTTTVTGVVDILAGELDLGSSTFVTQGNLDNNGTLTLSSGLWQADANVSFDGTLNAGTSTVELTGSIQQTFSGTAAAVVLHNLDITGTGGLAIASTLASDPQITGYLTLNGGDIVVMAPRKLVITSTGDTLRSSGYIEGTLTIQIPAGQTRRFEIGSGGTLYSPIEITAQSAATINASVTGASSTGRVGATWSLSGDPTTVDLKYYWLNGNWSTPWGHIKGFVPAYNDGSSWSFPAGYVDWAGDFASVNGVANYAGTWTAAYVTTFSSTAISVANFEPVIGPVGTAVTIYGSNFTATTGASFNGTPAGVFSVVNDNEIATEVPVGATTGTIVVTDGSTNGTSFDSFTVATPTTITTAQSGNWTSPSTWVGNAVPNYWDSVVINHPVVVDDNVAIDGVTLNADLSGGFTLVLGGTMDWNTGTVSPSVNVSSGAVINVATGAAHLLDGSIQNNGTINLTGNSLPLTGNAGIFNNGTVDIQGDFNLGWNLSGSAPPIDNNGTITKSAGGALSSVGAGADLTNDGTFSVTSGTLKITSFVDSSGGPVSAKTPRLHVAGSTYTAQTGATLELNAGGDFANGVDFTGSGTILFNTGASFSDTLNSTVANFILDANATFSWTAATFTGGTMTWKQGVFTGSLTLGTGATIEAETSGGSRTMDGLSFVNNGSLVLKTASVALQNAANVTSNGTVEIQGDYDFRWNNVGGAPGMTNAGTFVKTAGSGTSLVGGGSAFANNSGAVLRAEQAILEFISGLTNSGTIEFELNGSVPLTDFGRIAVSGGTLTLGGTAIATVNFVPNGGTAFQVMTFTSRSGDFAAKNYTFGGTRTLSDAYGANDLTLTASGPTITSLSPAIGTPVGNTPVTINGTGFVAPVSVVFDTTPATNVIIVNANQITCDTPAHSAGLVDVTVTANGEPFTSVNAFTFGTVTSVDVTTTANSGAGSLREAISLANAGTCSPNCTITFSIGTGLQTITPTSALPAITATNVTIDGTTQEGFTGTPLIEINGASTAGQNVQGLVLDGDGATIKSLLIRNFNDPYPFGYAIHITSNGNAIKGCYLGTNAAGNAAAPNHIGIVVDASSGNTIGGTTAADRNLISGNTAHGISIESGSSSNTVIGNYIGTDFTGALSLGNGFCGINLEGSPNNVVGGSTAAERNVISAHLYPNVLITLPGSTGNAIKGNYIGINAAGTVAMTNGDSGVEIKLGASSNTVGGTAAGAGNVISGSLLNGVTINASPGNTVAGNLIGRNATDTADIGNLANGVALLAASTGNTIGGSVAAAGNKIAGNSNGAGVYVSDTGTSSNLIQNNTITGNVDGIALDATAGAGNRILQNAIWGNTTLAIDLDDDGLVAANDATDSDTGPNNNQNYPILSSASINGTTLSLNATINSSGSAGGGLVIELYEADGSFPEQALTYLGSTGCLGTVLTNQPISMTVAGVTVGDKIVATATSYNAGCTTVQDGTSELSPAVFAMTPDPHWASPVSGNWNDPTKWSTGAVPLSTETAYIDATGTYTVTFSGADRTVASVFVGSGATLDLSANTLTVSNPATVDLGGSLVLSGSGTLAGAGGVTVNGGFNFTGGTLATTVTLAATRTGQIAGTLTLASTGNLVNNGTINLVSGGINAGGAGALITNNATGTFDIQGNLNFGGCCTYPMLTINNAGTFTKSAGTGLAQLGGFVAYNMTGGTTDVSAGTLELQGGNSLSAGTLNVASGATLKLFSNVTVGAPVTVTAAGTIQVTNGTTTMNAAYSNVGTTIIDGGTLSLANASTTNALTFSGGTLTGAGSLTVNGNTSWSGGTLNTTLVNPTTRTTTINGTVALDGSGTFQNDGTTNVTASINGVNAGGSDIINTGTFDIQANVTFGGCCTYPMLTITNSGTFTKSGGTGLAQLGGFVAYNMTGGTTDVSAGTLELQGGNSLSAGTLNVASGATLKLFSNVSIGAPVTITAPGTIHVSNGTTTMSAAYANVGATIVDGGTLSLANASTTNALTFSGGTLTGAGSLTVNGNTSWSGGTLNTTLVNPTTRTTTISGTVALDGSGTFQNDGTTTVTASINGVNVAGSDIINTGTFDIQGNVTFGGCCTYPMLTITNSGTFTRSSGAGLTQLGGFVAYNMTGGTTDVSAGTLELQGGNSLSAGTLNVASGATLKLFSNVSIGAPVTITAPGTIQVSNGTTTMSAAYANVGATIVDGGTLSLANASTTNALTFSGGTLTGAGSLTVNGNTSWSGGTLNTTLVNPTTRTATISGTVALDGSGTFQNDGTATVTAPMNGVNVAGSDIINTGTFDIQGNVTFGGCCTYPMLTITNSGTFTRSAGAGLTQLGGFVAYNMTGGTTDVSAGTLELQGGNSLSAGALNVASGTTLKLFSNVTVGAPVTITAPGTIQVTNGTTTMNAAYSNVGTTVVDGGTLTLANASTTNALTFSSGTLAGAGSLNVNGNTSWSGGTLNTTLVNPATRTATLTGTLGIDGAGVFQNDGTTNWVSGAINATGSPGSVINNTATGLFDIQGDLNFGGCCTSPMLTINNNGILRKSAGTGNAQVGGFVALNQNATLDIRSGAVQVSAATFVPGGSSTVQLWLTSASVYSRLLFSANATLGGTLNINYFGGFTPALGDTFQVLTFPTNSPVTDFAAKTGLTYSGGALSYALNGTDVTLTAVSTATAVSIAKSAPANVSASQTFSYTITVTNSGPNPATSVSVTDVMQAGMVPSNVVAPSFTCSGTATLTCTAASLAVGNHTITFDVTAPSTPQSISNVANLSASNDTTPGDNTSTAVTNVGAASADLAVTTAPSAAFVTVGNPMTWTTTVTNNGPSNATGVVVTDTLPAGQTITAATATSGTCSFAGSTVTCNVGGIANGNSITVTITASADEGGTRLNQAVAAATEPDGNNANDVGTATVVVTGDSTLVVTTNGAAGTGSLWQAITDANAGYCPAVCTISFNIAGSATIAATQPAVTMNNLVIDATTQPGWSFGTTVVALDGTSQAPGTHGLVLQGSSITVRGLGISGYTDGVRITGANAIVMDNAMFNNTTGVSIAAGVGARVIANSIYNNTGLPIDHEADGVAETLDAGDVDTGANNLQNAPVISSVEITPTALDVTLSVDSSGVPATQSLYVEVYKTDGSGEPQTLHAGGCFAGNSLINQVMSVPIGSVVAGNTIVATATSYSDAACGTVNDGTSEVSAAVVAGNCVPPAVSITGPAAMCAGGSVTLDAGLGHTSYLWTPGNFTTQTINVSPASTTTYTVTVTDASGCANNASHVVTVNTPPPVAITGPAATCGTAVTLNATAGFSSYLWMPGSLTGPSVTVTPTATTTYTLTATDGNGCQSTTSHTVTFNSPTPATITPSGATTFCAGGSVTLTATAGNAYLWSPGGETTQSITVTAGATYGVAVTDINGCVTNATPVTVTVNPAPVVTITGPAATCASTPVTLDAGPGATYLWTPGNFTTQTITVSPATTTTYTVTVTDGAGCAGSATHTVTVSGTPTATISAPAGVCEATTGHNAFTAFAAGATYNWTITNGLITAGAGTPSITWEPTGLAAVQLGVTVTNGSCTATGTAIVNVTAAPSTPSITAPASVPASTSGHSASITPDAGVTYTWSISGGTIDGANTGASINFTAGTTSPLTLTVVGSINGCTVTASTNVTVTNVQPNQADVAVTKSAPATVTAGTSFTYTLTVTNAGPQTAFNVSLADALPAGVTVTGFNAGLWSCAVQGGQFNCFIPALDPGAFSTISLSVQAPAQAATIVNSVAVSSAIADPDASNDSDSVSTAVVVSSPSCPGNPPSLLSPANGATNLTAPVSLSWSAVAGATSYDVWLATDGVLSLATSTANASATVNVGSGTTSWYVVANGGSGCTSLTSPTRTFTVSPSAGCASHGKPQITSPSQAAVSSPVSFSWTAVPQAIGYRIWISVNGTALQDVATTDGAISASVDVPPGAIVAFVDALFNGCPPTRSEGVAFTVPAPDPCAGRGTATLISPANNSLINSSSVELRWNAAPSRNGIAPQYRVWASENGGVPEVHGTTGETSLRTLFERGQIVWYIETLYPGCASTESARFNFSIPARNDCGTARPELIAPRNVTVTSGNVAFSWSAVPDAIAYEIYLALGREIPALIGTVPAGTTTFNYIVPPGDLSWFVRAVIDRCPSRDSSEARFTFDPPASCENNDRPVAIAPLEGPPTTSPLTFSWSSPAGATRYELYASKAGQVPALIASTNGTEAPGIALAVGTHQWFVRAFFPGCSPLDSAVQEVTIVSPPAACADLIPPVISAPGQISSGVPFLLQWTPAPGATSYQLQISSAESFANAETITTTGTQHELVRTNNGTSPLAVFARVRALDSRCSPPTVTAYGPISAVFVLPQQGSEGAAPLMNEGAPVTYAIHLGAQFAGQTFTAVPNQTWLTVTPSSGVVPAAGRDLVVTANTAGLSVGTNLGAVTVTLTSPSAKLKLNGTTSVTSTTTVNLVTPVTPAPKNTPPPDALIIPAVANADGINSHFQSDVRVSNTSPQLIKYQLSFIPTGDAGITAGRQTTFSIEPGRTVALDDILKSWFGTGPASATGTLEVRPMTQTATTTSSAAVGALANLVTFASSRTFNVTPNGTFGQHIPAIPYANFVGKSLAAGTPSVLSLQQIAQSAQYRTNLGLVEGSGEPASLLVKVFGSNGAQLTEFPVNLNGGQHLQLNGVVAQHGITDLADGRIEVQVVSGNGKVTAYASVLDNATADPLLVSPVTLSDKGNTKWVVPGVADLNNGTANWQTDMRVFNAGTSDVNATLSFYSQNGGAPKTANVTIPAGQVRTFDKTLASVFGASNDGGAVHIATPADARLIATARTYNQTSGGTYGQFISAVTPAEAAAVGTRPLQLLQVEESNRFRSNIGLAEVSGNPVKLEISVVPPDAKFTAVAQVQLGANEFRQIGSLLKTVGLAETYNARVTVRAIEGSGRVTAYASVVDMVTNDPTYVPAQ